MRHFIICKSAENLARTEWLQNFYPFDEILMINQQPENLMLENDFETSSVHILLQVNSCRSPAC